MIYRVLVTTMSGFQWSTLLSCRPNPKILEAIVEGEANYLRSLTEEQGALNETLNRISDVLDIVKNAPYNITTVNLVVSVASVEIGKIEVTCQERLSE